MKQLDRFRGTLVGIAVGECLGAITEGMTQSAIRDRFGILRDLRGPAPAYAGEIANQARCLAESLVTCGEYDPEDALQRLVAWSFSSQGVLAQDVTNRTLAKVATGMMWEHASSLTYWETGGKTTGIHVVGRCAPLALIYAQQPEQNIAATYSSARLTHYDRMWSWAAVTLNLIISSLIAGNTIKESLSLIVDHMEDYDVPVPVLERLSQLEATTYIQPTTMAFDALEAAIVCCLRTETAPSTKSASSTKSAESALVDAVNLGGASQATGAVCGALVGASYGLSHLPDRWWQRLEDVDAFVDLADRLYSFVDESS
ncbi:MAG: ADP-ribosylglycohydrolase family protein [Chloroflexota bacterium]|nr:ADP-ribosylglycohydrolase family protein [Chloroflexota bacterium]MDE2840321.1 ADP-ribosylglycohydrolase family protein [Chloroflexota bacterium]MDE2929758.1 ADP-ribosylglycohydrolase family protein [Chloroflexota bacterium]